MTAQISKIARMSQPAIDLLAVPVLGDWADGGTWDCPAGFNECHSDGASYVLCRVWRGPTRQIQWVAEPLYRSFRTRPKKPTPPPSDSSAE